MPCRRKDEYVFGEMLSIRILSKVVAEICYNSNICIATSNISVSKALFSRSIIVTTYIINQERAQNDQPVAPRHSPSQAGHYETTAAPLAA
jgi:hypothetical protein